MPVRKKKTVEIPFSRENWEQQRRRQRRRKKKVLRRYFWFRKIVTLSENRTHGRLDDSIAKERDCFLLLLIISVFGIFFIIFCLFCFFYIFSFQVVVFLRFVSCWALQNTLETQVISLLGRISKWFIQLPSFIYLKRHSFITYAGEEKKCPLFSLYFSAPSIAIDEC